MKLTPTSLGFSALLALTALPGCGSEEDFPTDGDETGAVATDTAEQGVANPDIRMRGRSGGVRGQARRGGGGGGNGINYAGGPVMVNGVNLYVIWYGNWALNPQTILTGFMQSLGGTPYWAINTTYTNAAGAAVRPNVTLAGQVSDAYSAGSALSDAQIQGIVSAKITSGALPADANGIYVVLTSADVNATSGFCTQYCGWHTHATIANTDIKYAFVGSADRCLASCAAQNTGPNGDAGADATASILAHEIEEAATDPDLNAWFDSRGYENADKCAWTYGTTSVAPNGAQYNVTVGGRNYLIQRNWKNAGGGACVMSYP